MVDVAARPNSTWNHQSQNRQPAQECQHGCGAIEIVLISIRRSEMAKPGAVVAMIVVAGRILEM
jgi:hypothetical protein